MHVRGVRRASTSSHKRKCIVYLPHSLHVIHHHAVHPKTSCLIKQPHLLLLSSPLLLLLLLLLTLRRRVLHPLRRTRHRLNAIAHLPSADQTQHDTRADHKRQNEPVGSVPWRCPAHTRGARVDGIEDVEGEELGDERVLDGEEDGGPGDGGRDHPDGVAFVAAVAAVLGPLEAPVDGAEEGEDLWVLAWCGGESKEWRHVRRHRSRLAAARARAGTVRRCAR